MKTLSLEKRKIAVIGGGLGGLCAAITAANQGGTVTLFEKNSLTGGKMGLLEKDGFSWDMGPSLLTLPETLRDFWQLNGEDFDKDLELVRLDPVCRYHWSDGTVIDEDEAFWKQPEVAKFLKYARGLYEISADVFLKNPLDRWWQQLQWSNLGKLRHFPSIASFQTMDEKVRSHFKDPHLVQLFNRFATYNGSSPFKTPSAFNIIPYVEAEFGGWYVRGGMHRIAVRLREMAERKGVRILTGSEVSAVAPLPQGGVRVVFGGETRAYDAVICNADVLSAHRSLLPTPSRETFEKSHLRKLDLSISGFVLFLGVRGVEPGLAHHNIFFSDDYAAEFDTLFQKKEPAQNPTIYVAVNSKHDPARAPEGCENWFVLVNAPNHDAARHRWQENAPAYADHVLQRLEQFGFRDLKKRIITRTIFTPEDFENRYRAFGGGIYGFASHGVRSAFQRPAMDPKDLPGIYFCGGSTHPGGGVPLVIESGRMAAERMIEHLITKKP